VRKAYILINLGAPSFFTEAACKDFLYEFLSDRFVLNIPAPFRQILAKYISKKRAGKYAENLRRLCKTEKDHPIIRNTKSLAAQVQEMSGIPTYAAFRYGGNNIKEIFTRAKSEGAQSLKVVGLYPQNAYSSTQTALKTATKWAKKLGLDINFNLSYFDNAEYINLLSKSVLNNPNVCKNLLASFHSVPISHLTKTRYLQECQRTVELLQESLGKNIEIKMCWQSKMGKGRWLTPSTIDTAKSAALEGVKDLLVICAGFSCDCTETLVEIKRDLKIDFIDAGGNNLNVVKCLNDSPAHAQMLKNILENLK